MKMFFSGRKPKSLSAQLPNFTPQSKNLVTDNTGTHTRDDLKMIYTDCLYNKTNTALRAIDQRSPVLFSGEQCKAYVTIEDLSTAHKITLTLYSKTQAYKFNVGTFTTSWGAKYRHCLIFNGTPHFGCGLYALVSIVSHSAVFDMVLCELSADKTDFIRFSDDDYYTPTVLIHGRGNEFYRADESVRNTLKEPEKLQPHNILCDVFSATYRTDGKSYKFYLPESNIANQDVKVSFRGVDGEEYNWTISANESYSATHDVLYVTYDEETGQPSTSTKKVGVYVNRVTGIIITHVDNVATALPFVDGVLDNFTVTAKANHTDSSDLLSGTEFFTVDSNKNGGQSTVIINKDKNKMYFSSPTDLFYFPETNVCEFSLDSDNGFGVHYIADKTYLQSGCTIYAVKSGSVKSSDGVTVSSTLNINKTEADVKKGCNYSVRAVSGKLYFLSDDGYICSLNDSNVKRENGNKFKDTADVWSQNYNGEYILCIGNDAYFADEQSGAFHFENFGENVKIKSQNVCLMSDDDSNFTVYGFDKSDNVFGSYLLENADFDVSAKKSFYKIRLHFNCETAPKDKITLTLTDEYSRKCIREFMIFSAGEKYKDIYFNFRCRNLTVALTLPNDVRFSGGEIFYTI